MIAKIVLAGLILGVSGCAKHVDGTAMPDSKLLLNDSAVMPVAPPVRALIPPNLAAYENLTQANNPTRAASRAYYDQKAFVLVQDMVFNLRGGESLTVPSGFVTDYASIPQMLWSIYSPHDVYSRAAVVHDYLYWTQQCSKEQADKLFLIAMKESSVNFLARNFVYGGVSAMGRSSWCENKELRAKGLPRQLESKFWTAPKGESWVKYQAKLFEAGLRDPVARDYSAICRYGDMQSLADTPPPIKSQQVADTTKC